MEHNFRFYVVVNSDSCKTYFPSNTSFHFKIKLEKELALSGKWFVGVANLHFNLRSRSKTPRSVCYLHSDICSNTIVDDSSKPLLRQVFITKRNQYSENFNPIFYLPVKRSDVNDIEFYITDENSELASFLDGNTTVTLHFRSYPFFN